MKTVFERLVRFSDPSGKIFYGEAPKEADDEKTLVGRVVPVYDGENPWDLKGHAGGRRSAEIAKVLVPIPSAPLIYGIGLNFKSHLAETSFPVLSHPTVFTKPCPGALTDPYSPVYVSKECQRMMDYEGELAFVIGQDCKNVGTKEEGEGMVMGYTAGNDVSCRYWQAPERCGGQHGYAKGMDGFAPLGPVLVSPAALLGAQEGERERKSITLTTTVNGEERQRVEGVLEDLLFGVGELVVYLSRGTTLRKGTVVMTGTPGGVAAFMKPEPKWLEDGDVVEVRIGGIGTVRNEHVFED
ncbi:hypothetical protein MKZ38_000565 [Zalerion maritima]|uniref:Fumarylacetoacetase-like C-terminal domain-containing protein n=1 Tax=Zalerion maritima TaxID=339359 RepID=A0AAD5RZA2_9PEZI|nr:hypothetical protein MKZ38_000565 [Zalerion maritima]